MRTVYLNDDLSQYVEASLCSLPRYHFDIQWSTKISQNACTSFHFLNLHLIQITYLDDNLFQYVEACNHSLLGFIPKN